ncbi:unnamed protein product [Polarella glacialis]|uniref:Uncharacterized protein n=1 Tax=Polarella glacialis TaxID=89957 RepID=A0A813JHN3_POLGL|nr:unnamed protein product [Polarella glacialis]
MIVAASSYGLEAPPFPGTSQGKRRRSEVHQSDCDAAAAALFRRLDPCSTGYVQEAQVMPLWPALTQCVEAGSSAELATQLQLRMAPISFQEWMSLMVALRSIVGARRFRSSLRRAELVAPRGRPASMEQLPPLSRELVPVPGAVDTSPRSQKLLSHIPFPQPEKAISGYQGGGGSMKPAAMTPLNLSAIPFEPTTLAAPEFMSGYPAPEEQAEKQVPFDTPLAAPVLMSGYPVAEEAGKQVPFESSLAAPVLMSGYPVAEEAGKQDPLLLVRGYPEAEQAETQGSAAPIPCETALAPVLLSDYPAEAPAAEQAEENQGLSARVRPPAALTDTRELEESQLRPTSPALCSVMPDFSSSPIGPSRYPVGVRSLGFEVPGELIPAGNLLASADGPRLSSPTPSRSGRKKSQGFGQSSPSSLSDFVLRPGSNSPSRPASREQTTSRPASREQTTSRPVSRGQTNLQIPGTTLEDLAANQAAPGPPPAVASRGAVEGEQEEEASAAKQAAPGPPPAVASRGAVEGVEEEANAAKQAAPGPPPAVASRGEVEGVEAEANAAKQAAPGPPPPPASRGEVEGEQQEEASAAKQAAPGPPPPPGSGGEVEGVEEENRAAKQAAPGPLPPPIPRGDVDCEQQEEESSAAKEAAPGPPPPPVSRGDVDFERQEEEAIAGKQAAPGPPLPVSQGDADVEEDDLAAKQLRAITISEADLVVVVVVIVIVVVCLFVLVCYCCSCCQGW